MTELAARLERLEGIFAIELAERARTLKALLLQLEHGPGEMAFDPLGRELHNLKGAARAVGARRVEEIAHAAEGAVLVRRGLGRPQRPWIAVLDRVVDALPQLCADHAFDGVALLRELEHIDLPSAAPTRPLSPAPPEQPQPQPQPQPQAPALIQPSPKPEIATSVRVSVGKLDTLLTESGELSVTHLRIAHRLSELRELQRGLERWQRDWRKGRPVRARLRRAHSPSSARDVETLLRTVERADQDLQTILHRTSDLVSTLNQNTAQLGAVANAIGQEVMAIRLLPAGTIFTPLERLVRDLARQTGKEARLALSGTDTEIDRRILDELRDPLMHMVRNTIDHGLETPEERQAAGKPTQGVLRLAAEQRGDRVSIIVEDDGRGLDVEAIRATAVRRGLLSPERAEALDTSAAIDLIFHPGFSTRDSVTELSGRGVGMDVVREAVTRLGGTILVKTTPGAGTTFVLTVPLTLATTRVLLVEDGGETFAVPSSTIERTGRVRVSDLQRLEGRRAVQIDGRAVPVVDLSEVLQRPLGAEPSADEWRPFFVLPQGDKAVALLTDRLVDEQELVVKGLGAPLLRVKHVGGAAVLGTGAVVVILSPSDLIKSALGNLDSSYGRSRDIAPVVAETVRRRVLVVDDSVMTRTLERSILESAGYQVFVAGDGVQAMELLATTEVDVVVSDVEMPRMSGLELTTAVRADERLRQLPVVLVTSLDSPEHVERGAAAGADAYIVKGRFDQNDLLQTVGRLL